MTIVFPKTFTGARATSPVAVSIATFVRGIFKVRYLNVNSENADELLTNSSHWSLGINE